MTDNNHPIIPPLELVEQWECEYHHMTYGPDLSIFISEKAARWGSDQELEACIQWIQLHFDGMRGWCLHFDGMRGWCDDLRAARRPKPPSLKEQALQALSHLEKGAEPQMDATEAAYTIRRALESLPE